MKMLNKLLIASAISGLVATSGLASEGEKIFTTKKLGNCVACHAISGNEKVTKMGPGSFGPDLSMLKGYPEDVVYDAIYDIYASRSLPNTAMPAYGKSGLLNDAQIKALVSFLTK